MKKSSWMKIGMIAILTVLSAACGRNGQVAGKTYVATGGGYGAQTAYGYNPYNSGYGYNSGYNGYNNYGYNNGMSSGESISFDNNGRATYRLSASMQPISGTYSFTDGNNTQLQLIPDAGTTTMTVGVNGPIRFMVSNDGNYITNQNTGQVLYRQ